MSDRDTKAKEYDAVVSGLRDEPCAFKRQCFRDGWDAALASLPNKAGNHPMSDMRETLMGIVAREVMDVGETADAIIAALPGMVKPLQWQVDERYPDEFRAGDYDIWHEYHGFQVYYWSVVRGDPHPTIEAAKAAAQAHHTAAILSAFGVQGGEA